MELKVQVENLASSYHVLSDTDRGLAERVQALENALPLQVVELQKEFAGSITTLEEKMAAVDAKQT